MTLISASLDIDYLRNSSNYWLALLIELFWLYMYFECFLNVCLILFLPLYYNVHASLKVNEGKINDAIIFFLIHWNLRQKFRQEK